MRTRPPVPCWNIRIQEKVLVQLENLRTHPAVAAGLASSRLKLHGWVYKIETGQVFAYDPQSQPVPAADRTSRPRPCLSPARLSAGHSI